MKSRTAHLVLDPPAISGEWEYFGYEKVARVNKRRSPKKKHKKTHNFYDRGACDGELVVALVVHVEKICSTNNHVNRHTK